MTDPSMWESDESITEKHSRSNFTILEESHRVRTIEFREISVGAMKKYDYYLVKKSSK